MSKDFFIMMYNQKEGAIPIIDENQNVVFFETEEEARKAVKDHYFCQQLGYEIFELGMGSI
jgi:hypothetical protein